MRSSIIGGNARNDYPKPYFKRESHSRKSLLRRAMVSYRSDPEDERGRASCAVAGSPRGGHVGDMWGAVFVDRRGAQPPARPRALGGALAVGASLLNKHWAMVQCRPPGLWALRGSGCARLVRCCSPIALGCAWNTAAARYTPLDG